MFKATHAKKHIRIFSYCSNKVDWIRWFPWVSMAKEWMEIEEWRRKWKEIWNTLKSFCFFYNTYFVCYIIIILLIYIAVLMVGYYHHYHLDGRTLDTISFSLLSGWCVISSSSSSSSSFSLSTFLFIVMFWLSLLSSQRVHTHTQPYYSKFSIKRSIFVIIFSVLCVYVRLLFCFVIIIFFALVFNFRNIIIVGIFADWISFYMFFLLLSCFIIVSVSERARARSFVHSPSFTASWKM